MLVYAMQKMALGVLTVLTVTVVLFLIMQSMPGDPIRMIADPRMPQEQIDILRARWGLDRPLHVQYLTWLSRIVRGDFGTSITTRQPVMRLISTRLPYTLVLAVTALILRYIIGIAVGLAVAVHRGSWTDRILVISSTALRSVPPFWLGIMLIVLFSVTWRIFPISGYVGPKSLVLPLLSLMLPQIADTMRLTRSEVLEVMREQYVTTAHSKGLPRRQVFFKHVLRNALIPVTVTFFLSLPWLIGGAVVVESVFAWPGMGRLLWRSIMSQDLPVVQGVVLIIAIFTVISNTIGDIMTGLLDPRIRQEYES